ncbi:MAG TPA: carboxymuconolactone decarboxylase family protein [Dehalococcoidia bacterium]|jgi:4-carboxymuconolactone decarboxylase
MTTPRPAGDPYSIVPKLGELRDNVLFGDIWERPQLSKRDRSLITCAVLTAMYRTEELKGHMQRALNNGVTKDELLEMITHVTFYSGWPTGVNAARVAKDVLV